MVNGTVFVASTLDNAPSLVDEIVRAGSLRGARVIYHRATSGPDPKVLEGIANEVAACDCFLVVLRGDYGEVQPGHDKSLGHLQVEMAIDMGVPCLWTYALEIPSSEINAGLSEVQYEGYRRLVSQLESRGTLEQLGEVSELGKRLRLGFNWLFRQRVEDGRIVLLSSTYRDLVQERNSLRAAVQQCGLGLPLIMFEDLPKGMDAIETSKRLAQKTSLYFGLLSDHRGSRIPDRDQTYTELEYEDAASAQRPIVLFENPNLHISATCGQSWTDRQAALRFNTRLREQHPPVHRFNNANELYSQALDVICALQDAGTIFSAEQMSMVAAPRRTLPPEPCFVHDYNLAVESTLIGREDALRVLDEWIADPMSSHFAARVLCVVAGGGMGKSALAWTWIERLQKEAFDACIWYSFYSVESGTHEFAESVLPYLSHLSGVADIVDSDASPLEQVLQILEHKKVLLVLDGLERRMKLYTDFGARAAEGAELSRIVDARIERHSLAYDEYPHEVAQDLARRECFRLIEDDAGMLRRLASNKMSRTLVTSRFFPSDLELPDRAGTLEGVKRYPLSRFDGDKAKTLAASLQVAWSAEFDTLLETVGGYPLYLALAFEYVRGTSRDRTTYEQRRKKLAGALALSADDARVAVVTLGVERLDERQREILYEIEACPIGSSFSFLRRSLCGRHMTFERPSQLEHELRYLHARKLIGWDSNSGSCDMHPVVRGVVRLQGTPELRERLLDRHKNVSPEVTLSGRVTALVSPFLRRPLTRLNLLEQVGKYEEGADYYLTNIDDLLRYHSAEIDMRRHYVERFLRFEDKLSLRTRSRLHLALADNALLLGETSAAQHEAQQALRLAQREKDEETLRLSYLTLAQVARGQGRLLDADLFLHQSIAHGALVNSDSSSRWTLCAKAELNVVTGRYEEAEKLVSLLEQLHPCDADVQSARLVCTIEACARGDLDVKNVEIAYYTLRDQCIASSLYYGNLTIANYAADIALQIGQSNELLDELKHILDDQAARHFIERRLDLKVKLAQLRTRQRHPEQGQRIAEAVRADASQRGLREIEARACLALAEVYSHRLMSGDGIEPPESSKEKALYYAAEASFLANADGAPYDLKPLGRAIARFYEDNGWRDQAPTLEECSPARTASVPEMPPISVPASPPGITNTKDWSDERLAEKLAEVNAKLDWENTTGSARKWWEAFENENKHRLALVLRLAEELAVRKATITEFFLAFVYSNTDNIQANLSYLDYTRLKKEEERKKKAANEAVGQSLRKPSGESTQTVLLEPYSPSDSLPLGITNTWDWSDERLVEKLAEVKARLDWENTTGSARKWWEAFENENKHRLAQVLRLAEELAVRRATVAEFFLAYVYGNTDNIQAIIFYLDYTRLKKEEERRKKENAAEEDERNRQKHRQEAQQLASSLFSAKATDSSPPLLTENQKTLLREHTPEGLSEEEITFLEEWCRSDAPTPEPVTDDDLQQQRASMSTDSSPKLTFVRCPACRILMSALLSQCHFCGCRLHEEVGGGK